MMRFFASLRMTAAVSFEHLIFGSFDPFDYAQGRLCSGQVLILFRISIFEFRVYGKMQKDLKIGMLLGLVLVTVAMVWLSTGPSLSPKAAGPDSRPVPSSAARHPAETGGARSNRPPQEDPARSNNFSTNSLTALNAEENQSEPLDSTIYSAGHHTVEQTEKIKTQKFHIVREGETLSEISHKYYGSANKWQKILDANRDVVEDVSKLKPGTKIIIPD